MIVAGCCQYSYIHCHTITTVTPSLLSHYHYCHTITTVIPSLLSHHHHCHTITTVTPSLLSHHHYCHTITTIPPGSLVTLTLITTVTPSLTLSHHHYWSHSSLSVTPSTSHYQYHQDYYTISHWSAPSHYHCHTIPGSTVTLITICQVPSPSHCHTVSYYHTSLLSHHHWYYTR